MSLTLPLFSFLAGMSTRPSPTRTMRRTTPASRHVPNPSHDLSLHLSVHLSVSRPTTRPHAYMPITLRCPQVTYKMSPIQIIVSEKLKPFYHFITSVCAIAGGVFTVAGLMDSVGYNTAKALKKKVDLGKQG